MKTTNIEWTEYDRGWITGLIEGEGSLSLLREYRPNFGMKYANKPRLNIGNKNLRILLKAKKLLGGSIAFNKKERFYNLDVSSNNLRIILPKLKLISKEKQRKLLIRALKILKKPRGKSHPVDKQRWNKLMGIREKIMKLNRLN